MICDPFLVVVISLFDGFGGLFSVRAKPLTSLPHITFYLVPAVISSRRANNIQAKGCPTHHWRILGGAALKRGLWVAYRVLLLGAVWLVLTASGELGGWAKYLGGRLPPLLILTVALAIPFLAALCSLRLKIDWRLRIGLFLLLLACVPVLPITFDSHPTVVVVVIVIFMAEEFGIIPLINKRWIARN